MQISRANAFTTIRTDGGLLPADLLLRITEGNRSIDGLTPESYHLAKSERLNEAATRAWNRLQGAWEGFQASMDKLPESDAGTTLTRERWLMILFQELGYGRLQTAKATEFEGKSYPISHTWQFTPVHLVSFRQELDRRTPGARGASRVSPHSLLQELLNRSDDHLWGFVSNGLRLRLLRDNALLTRAACVEFDLQSMMEGEVYSDFFLLYLLCHQSRVEAPEGKTVEHCWLERWYNTSLREGTRVLDHLRDGVEQAIEALGRGFLAHAANASLRDKLRTGTLSTQDYYRQVLRVVYRLLFLFVAEDRDLLLLPATPEQDDTQLAGARDLYTRHYSTQRLRRLAERRRTGGARHADLYRALRLIFAKLHSGCPQLALPALGSYLFAPTSTPDLNDADIANADLLAAIWNLTFTADGNVRRSVDYRNLGPEELGSVYESLLEMHPDVHLEAGKFELRVAAGSERKTTGSYYTPTSLVNCLLDSALEPVLDEACKKPNPEQALLDLKVCDPACGSGHFLIAAAHRIAKRLAAIRAGEDEPAPESTQRALRDVVGRCIYGVDINPMAVELCKINLWMEALEPGRPLTFLEHHVRPGNSLLGTTPALMKRGIPDDAFKPIEGDDKKVCSELKRRNKEERRGQGLLPFGQPQWLKLGNLVQSFANLADEDDSTPETLAAKEQHFAQLIRSTSYENAWLVADAWCAAFVCEKRRDSPVEVTEAIFRRWEDSPFHLTPTEKEELLRLRDQYNFFHWHLAFPEVFKPKPTDQIGEDELTGWAGGFDCVLGNPPWERPKPEPTCFFAVTRPEIATAQTSAIREQLLQEIKSSAPVLYASWKHHERRVMAEVSFLTQSGLYLLTANGKFNLGNTFVERAQVLLCGSGRVGILNLSGLATDDSGKQFIDRVMTDGSLVALYDFENKQGLFPGVHRMYKFSAITLAGRDHSVKMADFVFYAENVADLAERDRHIRFSADDISLLNPLSRTCPVFREVHQAAAVKILYLAADLDAESTRVLYRWDADPTFLFVMSDHSHLFVTREQLRLATFTADFICPEADDARYLPLYESKMFHQFDHRWACLLTDGTQIELTEDQRSDVDFVAIPRYWMKESEAITKTGVISHPWLIAVREVTNASNERTVIATILPRYPVGHNAQVFRFAGTAVSACAFLANLNSFALDFAARTKVGGSHLSSFILRQLPILPARRFNETLCCFGGNVSTLAARVLELVCVASDLAPFAQDCGYDGPSFKWDEERRFLICCEIDAAFFHLYLGTEAEWRKAGNQDVLERFPTPRLAVEYIMENFPIVKRKDQHRYSRYRTRDTILSIYDLMAEVIEANVEAVVAGRQPTARYQTALNPPPGPPTDTAGNFIPMAQWDRANWPMHIHQPRAAPVPPVAAEQVQIGRAVAYLTLLLHTWGKPVVRDALEAGLVFMLNDSIRQRVLRGTRPSQFAPTGRGHVMLGMDDVLSNMNANGVIDTRTDAGRMVVSVASDDLTAVNAPASDVAKAKEAIQAVQKLGESRTAAEYAVEIDVEYSLV